ncbi:hypothetical protein LEP1GSC005_0062 [Leptospira santarosai str. ST188]|nr:hypothetical protein LEP1GSC005_0062 [Leptospira santarosai str. ST188]
MKSQIQATRFLEELRFRTRTGLVFNTFLAVALSGLLLKGL